MIPTQAQYEAREATEFERQRNAMRENNKAERQEDLIKWTVALQTAPDLVAERVRWMLDGCYGYGAYVASRKVAANNRMNREAWMVQIIGAIEWTVREEDTRKQWGKLDKETQQRVTAAVLKVVSEHLSELSEEQA